jgi:hypothetical protein
VHISNPFIVAGDTQPSLIHIVFPSSRLYHANTAPGTKTNLQWSTNYAICILSPVYLQQIVSKHMFGIYFHIALFMYIGPLYMCFLPPTKLAAISTGIAHFRTIDNKNIISESPHQRSAVLSDLLISSLHLDNLLICTLTTHTIPFTHTYENHILSSSHFIHLDTTLIISTTIQSFRKQDSQDVIDELLAACNRMLPCSIALST